MTMNFIDSEMGWQHDSFSRCGGYFKAQPQKKHLVKSEYIDFSADKQTDITKSEVAVLNGNVVISYDDVIVNADKICLLHKNKKQPLAYAEGNVRMSYNNILLLADKAYCSITKECYLENTHFKLSMSSLPAKAAWGSAKSVLNNADSTIEMKNSSYSTCSYINPDWQLHAGYLEINTMKQTGFLSDGYLSLFGLPLFYFPVFFFPLENHRMSGFLYPVINYSDNGGWHTQLPYYLNLAPNYDLKIFMDNYQERGFSWAADFRFLQSHSHGNLFVRQFLNDRSFASFKEEMGSTYSTDSSSDVSQQLTALENSSFNRKLLFYDNYYKPNIYFASSWHFYWLSDDYIPSDFDDVVKYFPSRVLPRYVSMEYNHDSFFAKLKWEKNKVLQPIGQEVLSGIFNVQPDFYLQYSPNIFQSDWLNFSNTLHVLKFDAADSVVRSNIDDIRGERAFIQPKLRLTLLNGYLNSYFKTGLHAVWYDWRYNNEDNKSINKLTVPWFGLNGDVNRRFSLDNYYYLLKPRFLYKYVPYRNQNNLLVLDSTYPVESYHNLFRVNRFSGEDRIGDTNDIVLGISNVLLDKNSLQTIVDMSFGKSYAFQYHRVCISDDCLEDQQSYRHWSPWLFASSFNVGQAKLNLNLAFNNNFTRTNSGYFDYEKKINSFENIHLYYHYAKYYDFYNLKF